MIQCRKRRNYLIHIKSNIFFHFDIKFYSIISKMAIPWTIMLHYMNASCLYSSLKTRYILTCFFYSDFEIEFCNIIYIYVVVVLTIVFSCLGMIYYTSIGVRRNVFGMNSMPWHPMDNLVWRSDPHSYWSLLIIT